MLCFTLPPIGDESIVISVSVCLPVCVSVCLYVCLFCLSTRIFPRVHCDTLCISGFVDDVMFSYSGRNSLNQRRCVCFVQFVRWRHQGRSLHLVCTLQFIVWLDFAIYDTIYVDAAEWLSQCCYEVCHCVCSNSGLMSHEFFEPGVYYYSDQGYSEAAPYIGTIIVKPKVNEQFIELSQDGFSSGRWTFSHLISAK